MASYKIMKIKTFRADTPTDLERQINEWIDDKGQFPTFEVVSIDFKPLDNLNTVSFYGNVIYKS
jgi:hypothetical protein